MDSRRKSICAPTPKGRLSRLRAELRGKREDSMGCWRQMTQRRPARDWPRSRLFEESRAHGYEGSYDAVPGPGWSRTRARRRALPVVLDGVRTIVKACISASTTATWCGARLSARTARDGFRRRRVGVRISPVVIRIIRTAVETIFIGKEYQYNRRFLTMCGHNSESVVRTRRRVERRVRVL